MSNELLNYASKHFRVSVREMVDILYLSHATVGDDELEDYIQQVMLTVLLYSYFAGGAATAILFDLPYELFVRENYSPGALMYLEQFLDAFGVSLERRLPREARKRFGHNIAYFLPPEVLMSAMASYASTLSLVMARRIRIAKHASDTREASDVLRNMERTIVATEFVRGFTAGMLSASNRSGKVIGFLFSAVLDDRTSIYCRPRADMFIPIFDVEKLIRNSPPLHPNCRSVLVPVTREMGEVGRQVDDLALPQPPFYSPHRELIELALSAR